MEVHLFPFSPFFIGTLIFRCRVYRGNKIYKCNNNLFVSSSCLKLLESDKKDSEKCFISLLNVQLHPRFLFLNHYAHMLFCRDSLVVHFSLPHFFNLKVLPHSKTQNSIDTAWIFSMFSYITASNVYVKKVFYMQTQISVSWLWKCAMYLCSSPKTQEAQKSEKKLPYTKMSIIALILLVHLFLSVYLPKHRSAI